MKWLRALFGMILITLCLQVLATPLTATVDNAVVNLGETFVLTVTASPAIDGDLDLGPVEKDFAIYSTSRRSQYQVLNGQALSKTEWLVTLLPRTAGHFTIPKLQVADLTTEPVAIEVVAKKNSPVTTHSNSNQMDSVSEHIFFQVITQPETLYVNTPAVYTVKLFYDVEIHEANVEMPEITHAVIKPLGDSHRYVSYLQNKPYQVFEQSFVFTPSQAGELQIKPAVLQGAIAVSRHSNSAFSFEDLQGQPIRIAASADPLTVLPIPDAIPVKDWLPAQTLTATQQWSLDPATTVKAGQPITRTIKLVAHGATGDVLPLLTSPAQDNYKVYNDGSEVDTRVNAHGLIGERTIKIVYIPTQAGSLTLPSLTVPWYNTATKTAEFAHLTAVNVTVIADPQASEPAAPVPSTSTATTSAEPITNTAASTKTNNDFDLWFLVAGLASLWLLTIVIWWWRARRQRLPKPTTTISAVGPTVTLTEKAAYKALVAACARHDPQQAQAALLAWARLKWPTQKIIHSSQLGELLPEPTLVSELQLLDRALYQAAVSYQREQWIGDRLLAALTIALKSKATKAQTRTTGSLPPINPE